MPRDYYKAIPPNAINKPRLFQAYDRGWNDCALGVKDNPYPNDTGLFLTYLQGWQDRAAELQATREGRERND